MTRVNNIPENQLARNKSLVYLYAFSCFLVGVGSFFYHASLSFVGQWIDVMGMYLSVTFFILYNVYRLRTWRPISFYFSYFLLNILLGYLLYFYPHARRYLFGSFIFILICSIIYAQLKLRTMINHRYIISAITAFLLGFTIWILDIKKIACQGDSLLQGHAFWHFFTALAGLLIYFYYLSERDNRKV